MRATHLAVLACLALPACNGKDTDTGDSGETDVETDETDEPVPEGYQGFVEGPQDVDRPNSLRVAVVQAALAGGDAVTLGATLSSTSVSGTGVFKIDLPDEAPGTDLAEPAGHPGTMMALYLPLAHDDEDDNATYDVGEVIAGVSLDKWLAWIGGEVPEGWPTGWTLVDIKLGLDEEPTFHPLTFEARIESRGLETDVRLGAYYNGETETNLGLLGMDYHWVSTGSGDANPLFDKVLNNDSVVLQLDKRPGLSWWETDFSTGLRVARQVHWVYRDNDRSGDYNTGDDLLAPATVCDDDGSPVFGRKLDAATDLATAFALERKGWHAGWRLYKGADDELASSAGSTLSIDPTGCVTSTGG